jgi:alkylation response protein AidB-like acyl-CoA dehydrogenase
MPLDPANRNREGAEYLERARQFAPQLAAAAPLIDRDRELPPQIVEGLHERGFFRLLLPRSLGGAELLPLPYVQIIEAIAAVDASTAWCLNQGNGAGAGQSAAGRGRLPGHR